MIYYFFLNGAIKNIKARSYKTNFLLTNTHSLVWKCKTYFKIVFNNLSEDGITNFKYHMQFNTAKKFLKCSTAIYEER